MCVVCLRTFYGSVLKVALTRNHLLVFVFSALVSSLLSSRSVLLHQVSLFSLLRTTYWPLLSSSLYFFAYLKLHGYGVINIAIGTKGTLLLSTVRCGCVCCFLHQLCWGGGAPHWGTPHSISNVCIIPRLYALVCFAFCFLTCKTRTRAWMAPLLVKI